MDVLWIALLALAGFMVGRASRTHTVEFRLDKKDSFVVDSTQVLGKIITISYEDRNGEKTQREIRMLHFLVRHNDLMLVAYCLLRKGQRTFYVSHIGEVVDQDGVFYTGDDYFRKIVPSFYIPPDEKSLRTVRLNKKVSSEVAT